MHVVCMYTSNIVSPRLAQSVGAALHAIALAWFEIWGFESGNVPAPFFFLHKSICLGSSYQQITWMIYVCIGFAYFYWFPWLFRLLLYLWIKTSKSVPLAAVTFHMEARMVDYISFCTQAMVLIKPAIYKLIFFIHFHFYCFFVSLFLCFIHYFFLPFPVDGEVL